MSRDFSRTKCIRFNLKNPAEKRIYEYLESVDSFSTLIKHLITSHLASGWEAKPIEVKSVELPQLPKPKKKTTMGLPINFEEDE